MLMRYDPFRQVEQFLRGGWDGGGLAAPFAGMPMDAYRRGDTLVAEFDLPGVDRDSIDITVERNLLEVSAERAGHWEDTDDVLVSERPRGRVTRQLLVGQGVDTSAITADYTDGVLRVVLPIAEEAKPYKVEIGGGHKAVEAGQAA